MIKYFKELEQPNNQYLDLINTRIYNKKIELDNLPSSFFIQFQELFNIINNYDLLYTFNNPQKRIYLVPNEEEESLEWIFSHYINGSQFAKKHFSEYGIEKLNFLRNELKKNYHGKDFEEEFYKYFFAIYDQFFINDFGLICNKDSINSYLNSAYKMAYYQEKLTNYHKELFDSAFKFIYEYKFDYPIKKHKPVKMKLPNSWYITPFNHLYNTMGANGHKEANLIYPFYYDIVRDNKVYDYRGLLLSAKKHLEDGYVTKSTFDIYTNLIYDFSSIYPDEYYELNDLDQIMYNMSKKKTYNPRIVKLIAGIESAQAGLYAFFSYIKNNSENYQEDLKYIRQFPLDEILIRCCGFHKVSSIYDKTITTSCINYEEEFKEYIERGWHIDFVKPIIFNTNTKRVEEL